MTRHFATFTTCLPRDVAVSATTGANTRSVGLPTARQCEDVVVGNAAIIVAGGGARRLGGLAKPWLQIAGRPMIDHVIAAARAHASTVIVVGEPPLHWPKPHDVILTMEAPPGGGPAAAIRAALSLLAPPTDHVYLLAGDAPFVEPTLQALGSAAGVHDGVAAVVDGRVQYLCALLNRDALERALRLGGDSMRSVFDHLQIDTVEAHLRDADTWEDVAELRMGSGAGMSDNPWLDEASEMLDVEPVIDIDAVLALARDVAHHRERRNAPLTAFLLGFAAAQKGYSPAQVAEFAAKLGARAVDGSTEG